MARPLPLANLTLLEQMSFADPKLCRSTPALQEISGAIHMPYRSLK